MQMQFSPAAFALLLLAGTSTASAQVIYESGPSAPLIGTQPLQLTQAQRTTIYRTIIPQGRGRAPIVRERIVTEPVAPIVQERIITRSLDDYAYGNGYGAYGSDYAWVPAPRERVVPRPGEAYAYAVGSRVPANVRLAPIPPALVAEVPAVRPYRYMRYFDRVLLIDPVTSVVVADVTGY